MTNAVLGEAKENDVDVMVTDVNGSVHVAKLRSFPAFRRTLHMSNEREVKQALRASYLPLLQYSHHRWVCQGGRAHILPRKEVAGHESFRSSS